MKTYLLYWRDFVALRYLLLNPAHLRRRLPERTSRGSRCQAQS